MAASVVNRRGTTLRTKAVEALRLRIAAALDTPTPAVLDRLRAHQPAGATLSVAQVTALVDGLHAAQDQPTVSAATGLGRDELFDVIAKLGTWLRHIRGGPEVTLVKAKDVEQPELFAQAQSGATGPVTVIVPDGFERSGSGSRRDITKALGAIVSIAPTAEELSRFVARSAPQADTGIDFQLVCLVHLFARLGRIDELDQINPDVPELSRSLVAAWELLEDGRRTALVALDGVLSTEAPAELAEAVSTASALHQSALARFAAAVESGTDLLDARERLAGDLAAPDGVPTSVGRLNEAQRRALASAAGIGTEKATRTEESEIRQRLEELGLGGDADSLVPAGIRAQRMGFADAFWEAMELRADGDEDWQAPLLDTQAT